MPALPPGEAVFPAPGVLELPACDAPPFEPGGLPALLAPAEGAVPALLSIGELDESPQPQTQQVDDAASTTQQAFIEIRMPAL